MGVKISRGLLRSRSTSRDDHKDQAKSCDFHSFNPRAADEMLSHRAPGIAFRRHVRAARVPKENRAYWVKKLAGNRARDRPGRAPRGARGFETPDPRRGFARGQPS